MRVWLLVVFFVFFCQAHLGSLSLFHTSGTTFLNLRKFSYKTSIRYEFSTIANQSKEISSEIKEALDGKEIEEVAIGHFIVKGTRIGDIIVQRSFVETGLVNSPNGHRHLQGWIQDESDAYTPEQEKGDEDEIIKLVELLDNYPVKQLAVRVNVQVPANATTLVNLVFNIFRPENRRHILQENNFQQEKSFSQGFLEKVLETKNGYPTYEATMEKLFEDLVIRQTIERLGTPKAKAWTIPVDEARNILLGYTSYVHPSYALDLFPLLLNSFPEDPATKHLSQWIKVSDTIQFREYIGYTNIAIRRSVGLVKATELFGPFIHDHLLSEVAYVDRPLISKIRSKLLKDERIIVKYITWDYDSCLRAQSRRANELVKTYEKDGVLLGFFGNNLYGHSPLIIPGDSVVWHQRTEHRFNILAKYNPSLINFNIAHLLEHKYFEYLYFNTYCPGMFPKTIHVKDILPPGTSPLNVSLNTFLQAANAALPQGWVMKGIWDYNTQTDVLHNKVEYEDILDDLHESKVLPYIDKIKNQFQGCEPIEDINIVVRKTFHFKAWKTYTFLQDVRDVMIQEFIKIFREFRVECFGGKCARNMMTNDPKSEDDFEDDHDYYQGRVNGEFRKCMKSMPEKLIATPYTADVNLASDKKTVIIFETNPGGNGYLYHHDPYLLIEHNKFLKKYQYLYESEKNIQSGLTPEEQINHILNLAQHWGIDISQTERRFKILKDRIVDVEVVHLKNIDFSKINSVKITTPPRITSIGQRYKYIKESISYLSRQDLRKYPSEDLIQFLSQLALTKEGLDFNKKRYDVMSKYREIESSHVNSIFKKILETTKNTTIDHPTSITLGKYLLTQMPTLLSFQLINVNNTKLRSEIDSIFSVILSKPSDWNQIYFSSLNETNLSLFKETFQSTQKMKDLNSFLKEFNKNLLILRAMKRTGYTLPGISLSKTLQFWIPQIRALYSHFNKDISLSEMEIYSTLLETVIEFIDILSDSGLFYLDKQLYQEEYDFLSKSLNSTIKNPIYLGGIIESLLVLSGDEDSSLTIPLSDARKTIIQQMGDDDDLWRLNGKYNLIATLYAIKGLVEHPYLTLPTDKLLFGEMVKMKHYIQRLDRIELMKLKGYSLFNKNPNFIGLYKKQIHDEL